MIETYRMLGRERRADLDREAERWALARSCPARRPSLQQQLEWLRRMCACAAVARRSVPQGRRWNAVRRLLFLLLVVVAASAVALPAATSANRSSPVQLTFTKKQASANVYIGTIDGGGTIEMLILDRRSTAERQHFRAFVRVDVGSQWFAARVRGTFEFATLQTHLTGRVTDGNWLQGARVREEGQLVGMDPLTFVGTLTLDARGGEEDD